MSVLMSAPRRSALPRGLRGAVLDDFEVELVLVQRLAVMLAAGYRRSETARLLGVSPSGVMAADKLLKAAP
jgi:hypothetical protein